MFMMEYWLFCFYTLWGHGKPKKVLEVTSWKMNFLKPAKEDRQHANKSLWNLICHKLLEKSSEHAHLTQPNALIHGNGDDQPDLLEPIFEKLA